MKKENIINKNKLSGNIEVNPRLAVQTNGEMKLLEECENKIAAQMVVPYPPGILVILPGMKISKEIIMLILDVIKDKGISSVHGLQQTSKGLCIKVITVKDYEHNGNLIPVPF